MGCLHSRLAVRKAAPSPPLQPAAAPSAAVDSDGWPRWLSAVAGDALLGLTPRRPGSFEKLEKIGSGTYSNVYKAIDLSTGRLVALKKVRLDGDDEASAKFTAREVEILRRLGDHPNIVQLQGLVNSRVSHSLYLAFEYMDHDLAGLSARPDVKFSLPQVKCYMKQLLAGLEHCHSNGVLHRDIKGSNLLLDNEGNLKIADFGLASTFDPDQKKPMTNRVITLWYRPPELLLGAKYYGVGVDLWSAGCILAELLIGKPILPGRTEVEQLHKIFKLCGSPSEHYWKKSKLSTMFKPNQTYKRCIAETFNDLPPTAVSLIERLLDFDPAKRGTATEALNSEFFTEEPYACEPSSLPHYPPSKELDAKLTEEEARRQSRMGIVKRNGESTKQVPRLNRRSRAVPAPEANAELRVNLHRKRWMAHVNAASKSEKFPPPHQDAAVGIPQDAPRSFVAQDVSISSSIFNSKSSSEFRLSNSTNNYSTRRKNGSKERCATANPAIVNRKFRPSSARLLVELNANARIHSTVEE